MTRTYEQYWWIGYYDEGPEREAIYVPRSTVIGLYAVVRGGGGGGASGQRDTDNLQCLPGPGGGGGGCSQLPDMIRRKDLPPSMVIHVGTAGKGGVSPANSTTGGWSVGGDGTASWFGDLLYAGGGGGGGRRKLSDGTYVKDITAGGAPGYGMSRGGRGLTYLDEPRRIGGSWLFPRFARISEADAYNEIHMAAGGGGGGHGNGFIQRQDSDGDWRMTSYPWKRGGDSNAMKNERGPGWEGKWDNVHYPYLNTGCGGNGRDIGGGTGGQGGFPAGGGAGGAGSDAGNTVSAGGRGRPGLVSIIEVHET